MENFKKALELEPDNDSYKSNLQIAEDKVRDKVEYLQYSSLEENYGMLFVAGPQPIFFFSIAGKFHKKISIFSS